MAREREKKRDGDRPNKPGAISSVSGALFCEEHKDGGAGGGKGKRGGEKERREHLRECVQKERKHTHVHTRRLGSQSERYRGAAEPAATQEHLALPLIYPAHSTDSKTDSPKQNQRPRTHTHTQTYTDTQKHTLRRVNINSAALMQMCCSLVRSISEGTNG